MTTSSTCNYKKVLEFETIVQGYDYCRLNGPIPFVVRNCTEFLSATPGSIRSQINLEKEIHGYNNEGTHEVTGRVAYDRWLNDTLDFNIVDSSSSRGSVLLPNIIRELNIANDVDSFLWFSYVLTLAGVQSKCHIDPPFGSGWQFISEGDKEWTIIDSAFFRDESVAVVSGVDSVDSEVLNPRYLLISKTVKFSVLSLDNRCPLITACIPLSIDLPTNIPQPSPSRHTYPHSFHPKTLYDMDELSSTYPNELYRVIIKANDFISCPEDWPHSVYTGSKTCGLSGYMKYAKKARCPPDLK